MGELQLFLKLLLVFCLGTLGKRGTGETTEKSATERERKGQSWFATGQAMGGQRRQTGKKRPYLAVQFKLLKVSF